VIDTPYPEDLLFIEKSIYQHELRLEYALCSEQIRKRDDAVHASERALGCPTAREPLLETGWRAQ